MKVFCKNCGKEIDDSAYICPHCGVKVAADETKIEKSVEASKKINGLGIAGFVVSLVSLWLGAYFCIASIVGLVLSIVGMCWRKKCNSCNGLSVAGLVLGIVSLVIWALVWIIVGSAIIALIGLA